MSADVSKYTALVTSEHRKPNFLAGMAALVQGPADNQAVLAGLSEDFDLDEAVGVQLDAVGLWVGATRFLQTPLVGVFFAFDTPTVGFDQGAWLGPFDSSTGLTVLADEQFRVLIKATIAENAWDGTIPGAYAVWQLLFGGEITIAIQDFQTMEMAFLITSGFTGDAVVDALIKTGAIALKPDGVRVTVEVTSVIGAPIFGFDVNNATIAGFDVGAWAVTAT